MQPEGPCGHAWDPVCGYLFYRGSNSGTVECARSVVWVHLLNTHSVQHTGTNIQWTGMSVWSTSVRPAETSTILCAQAWRVTPCPASLCSSSSSSDERRASEFWRPGHKPAIRHTQAAGQHEVGRLHGPSHGCSYRGRAIAILLSIKQCSWRSSWGEGQARV